MAKPSFLMRIAHETVGLTRRFPVCAYFLIYGGFSSKNE
ncbi:hypothetical protein NBRC111894_3029 [Sporolactobacillus inulinus]|uniref:Uncharacterized protein n=1 Tax=Sporolactobacillus inulinus TaxID=2078 RepID=A0A4Y1ZEE7_9BACL|nr:hypothetical protein NBRC111894_3029 [Sporolactobacillus inulinus]